MKGEAVNLLGKIVYADAEGRYYYDIINSSGKEWLLNEKNLKTAFEIYQPTALKGRFLKKIFPYVHKCPVILKILGVKKKKISLEKDIRKILDSNFGNDYGVSYFGGTPSVHQKVMIQISRESEVRAYCKVSDNNEVGILFDKECDALMYLRKCGVKNIPRVIERKTLNGLEIFIQSNVKKSCFRIEYSFSKYSLHFLYTLYGKTRIKIRFNESDYAQMLNNLKVNCQKLNEKKKEIVVTAIGYVEDRYRENPYVEFSFYHGDFTPWNTAICNKNLCVFDFEYYKKTYPPYLDAFHFYVQTEIFLHHSSPEHILKKRKRIFKVLECLGVEVDFAFKLYLLEIINLYLSRTICDNEAEIKNMELRLRLLQELNKT